HPQLGVPGRTALDQRVHRVLGVDTIDREPVPRMTRIGDSMLRFFQLARTGALLPFAARRPFVEMPARAVVKHDVSLLARASGVDLAEQMQERQVAVVTRIE